MIMCLLVHVSYVCVREREAFVNSNVFLRLCSDFIVCVYVCVCARARVLVCVRLHISL